MYITGEMLNQTQNRQMYQSVIQKGNNGAQTAALSSPACIVCFVQVSVWKSIFPVQYSADQLPSIVVKKTLMNGCWYATVRFKMSRCGVLPAGSESPGADHVTVTSCRFQPHHPDHLLPDILPGKPQIKLISLYNTKRN